jgi:hypothetical protein
MYVVGLPKTGSTSLTTLFGNYRTGHEVDMDNLLLAGLAWRARTVSEDAFWEMTTPRLTRPVLEMDSATCHHLYADLLVKQFPRAFFIHSVRDVGGWLTSLLDMSMRQRLGRLMVGKGFSPQSIEYMDAMTGGNLDPYGDVRIPDREAVAPMIRYWAAHMRQMPTVLPPDRSLVVRTRDLAARLDDLAGLVNVPVQSLRADLAHANKAPHALDRMAFYWDDPRIRRTYEQDCADIMAEMFPEEHARVMAGPTTTSPTSLDWDAHYKATERWVQNAVAEYGEAVAR